MQRSTILNLDILYLLRLHEGMASTISLSLDLERKAPETLSNQHV